MHHLFFQNPKHGIAFPIYPICYEEAECSPTESIAIPAQPFPRFFFLTDAKGILHLKNLSPTSFHGNLGVFLPAGCSMLLENTARRFSLTLSVLSLSSETDRMFLLSSLGLQAPLAFFLSEKVRHQAKHLIRSMLTAEKTDPLDAPYILSGLSYQLILIIASSLTLKKISGQKREIVSVTQAYMEEHYSEVITSDDLCQIAHTSAASLNRAFQTFFGMRPLEYLIVRRMAHAAYYLTHSDLSVSEIAAKVGYYEPSYFCHAFLQRYHISPGEYRKKALNTDQALSSRLHLPLT